MLYVERALMHSVPECQFTGLLSYQLIKDGQPPHTSHVSKEKVSEIRNTALPEICTKKKELLAAFVCLSFHMLQVEKS